MTLHTPEEIRYFGRVLNWTATGLHRLSHWFRYQRIFAFVGGVTLTLPDARRLPTGGPVFVVHNTSGSNSISIEQFGRGSTLHTIPASGAVEIYLIQNSDSAGVWAFRNISPTYSETAASNQGPHLAMFLGGSEDASNAREFNPYLNTWTERTDGTNSHDGGSGFTIQGVSSSRAFVAGHNSSRNMDEYDPHAWTSRAAVPGTTSRHQMGGAGSTLNGYVFGGFDSTTAQSRADRYSQALNTWATRTALGSSFSYMFCSMSIAYGRAIICGGGPLTDFSLARRETVAYIESSNSYLNVPHTPYSPRCDGDSAVSGTKFFVFGGVHEDSGFTALDSCFELNIPLSTWSTTVPSIPWGVSYAHGAVALGGLTTANPSIILAGGRVATAGSAKDDCAQYHPLSRTWTTKADIGVQTSRWDQQCGAPSK